MSTPVLLKRWPAVRVSLSLAVERFAELVLSAPDPRAMATAHWSIAEMAAHVRYGPGVFLDSDVRPRERRVTVEFRSPHTVPVAMVLHRGAVSAEECGSPADIRISFDPETLVLMLFHRIGKGRAVLSGKVRVTGPRPWLLPGFLRVVRAP